MDIFISYQNKSQALADKMYEKLVNNNFQCWYAPRIQYGDYAKRITEAIKLCKVFIVLVDKNSSTSDHVLNEIEIAYKRYIQKEIVIIPFKLDNEPLSESIEYYFSRMQWVDAFNNSIDQALDVLIERVISALGLKKPANQPTLTQAHGVVSMHESNRYYTMSDFNETRRLANEDMLLSKYEGPILDNLLSGKKGLVCLDLNVLSIPGCIDKINRSEIGHLIGLTYSEEILERGRITVNGQKIEFYKVDFDENFEEQLAQCLSQSGVDKIDVVCSCMALMDFKNPFKVLKSIKKFLAEDAVMLVREVDDGAVFASPDKERVWAEFQSYYKYNVYSGYRFTGRMVYSWLKKIGAKEIKLEHYGINTSDMTSQEKELIFNTCFSFMYGDMSRMLRECDPNDKNALDFLKFYDEHFLDMEEEFASDDFIFNSCYVIYSAKF